MDAAMHSWDVQNRPGEFPVAKANFPTQNDQTGASWVSEVAKLFAEGLVQEEIRQGLQSWGALDPRWKFRKVILSMEDGRIPALVHVENIT